MADRRNDTYRPYRVRARILDVSGQEIFEEGINVTEAVERCVTSLEYHAKGAYPVDPRVASGEIRLTFADATEELFEYGVEYLRSGTRMEVSFDYEDEPHPWVFDGQIVNARPLIDPAAGVTIAVQVMPRMYSQLLMVNARKFALPAKFSKAHEAVRAVVAELARQGITLRTEAGGISTIQECADTLPHNIGFYPSKGGADICAWIMATIGDFAADATGSPFVCYLDNDVLHFHTVGYVGDVLKKSISAVYAPRDPASDVIAFEIDDHALNAIHQGYGAMSTVGWDARSGSEHVVDAGATVADQEQRMPSVPASATSVLARESVPYQSYLGPDDRWQRSRRNQHLEALRQEYMKVILTVRGTHAHNFGSLIGIEYARPSGAASWLSGTYTVLSVNHSVSSGGWVTRIEAMSPGMHDVSRNDAVLETRRLAAEAKAVTPEQVVTSESLSQVGGVTVERSQVVTETALDAGTIIIHHPNAAVGVDRTYIPKGNK